LLSRSSNPLLSSRLDINPDDFGQFGRLGCSQLAGCDSGGNGCGRFDAVGGLLDPRQLHGDRLLLDHRHEPIHAHANGRPVALHRQFDHFGRYALGAFRQQILRQDGCAIERAARPSGRISAFAFLKRHGFNLPSYVWRHEKPAVRGREARSRNKKPGAARRPGLLAQFR
jgi:hypothetical protein